VTHRTRIPIIVPHLSAGMDSRSARVCATAIGFQFAATNTAPGGPHTAPPPPLYIFGFYFFSTPFGYTLPRSLRCLIHHAIVHPV